MRVVGGQVQFADAPAQQTAQGAVPKVAPGNAGVAVKPHEWGAAAMAGEPFYATSVGQARAMQEQALLGRDYPGFAMDVDEDGTPYVHGWLGGSTQLKERYHVLLVIPPGYGYGAMPMAHVLEPRLQTGAPHLFADGSLCLDHSGAFTRKSTLLTLLAWISIWLCLYEGWAETGTEW